MSELKLKVQEIEELTAIVNDKDGKRDVAILNVEAEKGHEIN